MYQRLIVLAVIFLAALFSRSGCCRLQAGGGDLGVTAIHSQLTQGANFLHG
jgi:hypothetical protein